MARLSSKLRSWKGGGKEGIMHWCQGCKSAHVYITNNGGSGPQWTWNGNIDKPTLSPSMRSFITKRDGTQRTLCHYFLTDGMIEFLSDSGAHEFRGKHPLEDIPDDYGGGED